MKKIFLLTAIIFAALNFTNAQAKSESPATQADRWVKNNNPILKLTADQESKVKGFAVAWYNELASNKVKYADNKKALDDANEESDKKFKKNVNSVLNADQQKAWEESTKKKSTEVKRAK